MPPDGRVRRSVTSCSPWTGLVALSNDHSSLKRSLISIFAPYVRAALALVPRRAGEWDRGETAGGPDNQSHGLAGVAVDELRLGVVVRLLVELLDPWHLPPGLGDLDSVRHKDDAPLDRVEEGLEERKDQARP